MSNEFKNWRVDYQGMGSKTSEVCTVYGITPVKVGDEVQDFAYIVVDGQLTAEQRTKALSLIEAAPMLLATLKDASGYLLNAKIDLEAGVTKATAIRTIEGGLMAVRRAIDKADGRS